MPSDVARHYAQVLLDIAVTGGDDEASLSRLAAGIDEFAAALERSPELGKALTSPAIPRERRAGLAGTVANRILPGLTAGTVRFGHGGAGTVGSPRGNGGGVPGGARPSIAGVVEAEVVSARPLDERGRASLRSGTASCVLRHPQASLSVRIRSCWVGSSCASGTGSMTPA